MNKVLEFKADGHWYSAVAWVWEPRGVIEPRVVAILVTQSALRLSGHGVAICAREDEFDIRVGVPLALKRALSQVKKVNRRAVTRAFFQQWKEAHPHYQLRKYRPGTMIGCVSPGSIVRVGDKIVIDGKVVGVVG